MILDSGAERTALTLDALKRLNIRFDFAHQATELPLHEIQLRGHARQIRLRAYQYRALVIQSRFDLTNRRPHVECRGSQLLLLLLVLRFRL
jgi:hypothetical protein